MFYITTTKNLDVLPEEIMPDDTLLVFYHAADTMKASDVDVLFQKTISVKFTLVADRDDMMFCLGSTIAGEEHVTYLDGSIPVPKRFADRITVVKQTKTAKSSAKRQTKKTAPVEISAETSGTEPEAAPVVNADTEPDPLEGALPKPEFPLQDLVPEPQQASLKRGRKSVKADSKPESKTEPKDELNSEYSGARAAFEKARAKVDAQKKLKDQKNYRDLSAFRVKKGE